MDSIQLKTKESLTYHCGCHGNLVTIATRYFADAYCLRTSIPNMDSIRLKTKELQSKMYLTQTQTRTDRLRLTDLLDSQKQSTHWLYHVQLYVGLVLTVCLHYLSEAGISFQESHRKRKCLNYNVLFYVFSLSPTLEYMPNWLARFLRFYVLFSKFRNAIHFFDSDCFLHVPKFFAGLFLNGSIIPILNW